ncbi:hypothetical protein G7072_14900 [Nocardioides sp. HDW12B]|uniref:hypothetical protein n=1 Tax=Nocardioides sp. HDW12B TaxID=2714939 RepID=UPI00140797F0|nr:hypothetical protein [Nocardioides sp. HDW12B]QIK67460.1 hypothetical protein G7072_14900 [Nocardioides sp. HDW12B]
MTSPSRSAPTLVPGLAADDAIDALVEASGGRVGLTGVLGHLNRVAEPAWGPGSAVSHAFAWDEADQRSRRWWPQGVTSSSEARLPRGDPWPGPPVLLTTSYAKKVGGLDKGSRITVADLGDPDRVRYRHVLLVRAVRDDTGAVDLRPVKAHAGGVVWHGPWLYVAATRRGVLAFRLDDVVRVSPAPPDRLGRHEDGDGLAGFGHGYALPLHHVLGPPEPSDGEAATPPAMRYSFLSLARGLDGRTALLAGEYDAGGGTRRLVVFDLDATGAPVTDPSGVAASTHVADGVDRMQGAVWLPDGRLAVTASDGRYRRGHLWVGAPGALERRRSAVPVGPEDLTSWPERGELWTATEYPGHRLAVALHL